MTPHSEQPEPSERPTRPDPIALALQVALYAPIGVAAYVHDAGPDVIRTVVARGRAEVDVRHEQVANRIRHAKGAGEVAIAFGLPILRRKVGERLSALRSVAEPPPAPRARPTVSPRPAPPPTPAATPAPAGSNGHHAPDTVDAPDSLHSVESTGDREAASERLAIPGYDALSASQVVERLAGLSSDELLAVRQYEASHRRRRTILGKIEQLSA
jgi:hypothetical protein